MRGFSSPTTSRCSGPARASPAARAAWSVALRLRRVRGLVRGLPLYRAGNPTATVSILHRRMELPFTVSPVTGFPATVKPKLITLAANAFGAAELTITQLCYDEQNDRLLFISSLDGVRHLVHTAPRVASSGMCGSGVSATPGTVHRRQDPLGERHERHHALGRRRQPDVEPERLHRHERHRALGVGVAFLLFMIGLEALGRPTVGHTTQRLWPRRRPGGPDQRADRRHCVLVRQRPTRGDGPGRRFRSLSTAVMQSLPRTGVGQQPPGRRALRCSCSRIWPYCRSCSSSRPSRGTTTVRSRSLLPRPSAKPRSRSLLSLGVERFVRLTRA